MVDCEIYHQNCISEVFRSLSSIHDGDFCKYRQRSNVKLIISNAPLTYVYSDTIKTYLKPNHVVWLTVIMLF